MALKRHKYPMSESAVKREGEPASGRATALSPGRASAPRPHPDTTPTRDSRNELALGSAIAGSDVAVAADERRATIVFRTLNYGDLAEVRAFVTLLYAISAEADPFHFDKSPEFIDRCVVKARREENASNTFSGLALRGKELIGVHSLRRFEEGPLVGAQVAGLWVAKHCRRQGVARTLKAMGEVWARSIGAHFLNSNVLVQNAAMLELNRQLGFESYRVNLRKRL
jgi:GNAT superfamily N-acetyltransferase